MGKVSRKGRSIVPILGVGLDSTRMGEVTTEISRLVASNPVSASVKAEKAKIEGKKPQGRQMEQLFVTTPNPEIILRTLKDPRLLNIINTSSIALPDANGLIHASRYLTMKPLFSHELRWFDMFVQGIWVGISAPFWRMMESEKRDSVIYETVPGRKIFEELLFLATQKGWKVYLLGSQPGSAEAVVAKLRAGKLKLKGKVVKKIHDSFAILGEAGPWLNSDGLPVNEEQKKVESRAIEEIKLFKPDLLFVGFGPPKQEKWLSRHLSKLPVKVGMVVGGSFDYVSGRVPLPPRLVEKLGLEWLWRLITQPSRARRIFDAVVVFPWRVYRWRVEKGTRVIH